MSEPGAPIIVNLESWDRPVDGLAVLALAAFLDGSEPFARSVALQRVKADHEFVPIDATSVRHAADERRDAVLARGPGWTMHVVRSDDAVTVQVTASEDALANELVDAATRDATEPEPESTEPRATFGFWYYGSNGPRRRERTLDITTWQDIRANYNGGAARAFDALMAVEPAQVHGRLLLLHGPPGTGKTTALRALTNEWRNWCRVDYVLDPDRLFADSAYLLSVAFDDRRRKKGWRLLVLEDCDELIRAHAKFSSGQSLSRLLNIADGLPGQGVQLLFAITTNEPLTALHPAIVRPGRCIAQVDVGRMSAAEARAWLGRPARIGRDGVTLAELYAQRDELTVVENDDPPRASTGQYL